VLIQIIDHTLYIAVSIPYYAAPIKFPVSHPLPHQNRPFYQNKNTKNNNVSVRIEILGFGLQKTQDFYIFLYFLSCVCFFFPLTLIDFYGLKG